MRRGTVQARAVGVSLIVMKTKIITALVASTGFIAAVASAQDAPVSPTPAPAFSPAPAPAPNQIVHAHQLPSVADLTKAAAAQGIAIKQIVQSARDISVSYQLAGGQTRTVLYQLLSSENPPAVSVPTVVYVERSPDYYYYGDPFYPGYGHWYPGFSARIGFGHRGRWR